MEGSLLRKPITCEQKKTQYSFNHISVYNVCTSWISGIILVLFTHLYVWMFQCPFLYIELSIRSKYEDMLFENVILVHTHLLSV